MKSIKEMNQAELAASNHTIDIEDVRAWSIREGKENEFKQIQAEFEQASQRDQSS